MLKQSLRPILYLLIALATGIIVTLLMDQVANIAVEKRIRTELKQEITNAAASFKDSAKTPSHEEVLLFIKKFSVSVMSGKIIAVNPEQKQDRIAKISLS